jgi:hypothetical protein
MHRLLGLSILWLAGALGLAHAAPVRLPHMPAEPPKMPVKVAVDLNGTAWLGKYGAANRTFIFEADGTVSYKTGAKASKGFKNRGFWKIEGNNLFFEHYLNPNQKLMEFRGVVKDPNTIVGEATFPLKGTKEQQTLQRNDAEPK